MNRNKVMIVDDDANIREVLAIFLESEGYDVIECGDGLQAIEAVRHDQSIDLIIMDIMMPGMDGLEACQIIRKDSNAPVLFLTAKSRDQDKMEAFNKGGDDYIVKPFSQSELLMKVRALMRRYKVYQAPPAEAGSLELGDIAVNIKAGTVIRDDVRINLTGKEFEILKFFVENRGTTVSNKEIFEAVWHDDFVPSDGNKVMVHILNLRRKLENDVNHPEIIKTVWGKGYQVD